ncbi:hypothetical protein REJC140_01064 [Pseudorhizobium endolithicum]|uniref:DUF454 domain-containing protein n=1 Tax=Pseudorhizobium endolithicum TaxID=1191678 RepID=A0ABN7JRR4_9HYPH|nr:YbaN family protein [Pseudorhizobium endolithicum]CAD7041879.1 hypothetical protein REJC140_01064 [Pseudorhizobium endolithicum]
MRIVYLSLGWLLVTIGLVGAFMPVLPTTPFLIMAVACFARSSPRLEAWLLNHPRFGGPLRDWREKGAVPRKAKIAAVAMMTISYGIFWVATSPPALRAAIVAAIMIVPAIYVVTRPEPGA